MESENWGLCWAEEQQEVPLLEEILRWASLQSPGGLQAVGFISDSHVNLELEGALESFFLVFKNGAENKCWKKTMFTLWSKYTSAIYSAQNLQLLEDTGPFAFASPCQMANENDLLKLKQSP